MFHSSTPHRSKQASTLRRSAGQRVAFVCVPIALLWILVLLVVGA